MRSSILIRLACVVLAFPASLRAEEGIDLRLMADRLPPDQQGIAGYLRTINRIVDHKFCQLRVADRNDLKLQAVKRLLEVLKLKGQTPDQNQRSLKTEYLVLRAYQELFGNAGAGERPVSIEGLEVAALVAPDSVLDNLEKLPREERRAAVERVRRLERDNPDRLGDLLAYVAMARCPTLEEGSAPEKGTAKPKTPAETFLAQLESHLPRSVAHARAVLADPPLSDTLYRRVFRFFGTLATGAGYLVLTGVGLYLVGLALSSLQLGPPPFLAKELPFGPGVTVAGGEASTRVSRSAATAEKKPVVYAYVGKGQSSATSP